MFNRFSNASTNSPESKNPTRVSRLPHFGILRLINKLYKVMNISFSFSFSSNDWNLGEQPLQVARCTKIINEGSDDAKYIINVKQFAKFVVNLADTVSPTDIEEGMRVGWDDFLRQRLENRHLSLFSFRVDRTKYQIHLPLPPKIDPSVTMMQVEEKPDVTYSDVGGCKEQIEKLREVVELPLLNVKWRERKKKTFSFCLIEIFVFSRKNSLIWASNHRKVFYFTDLQEPEKLFVLVRSPIGNSSFVCFPLFQHRYFRFL